MKWFTIIFLMLPVTNLQQVAHNIDEFLSVECPEETGDAKAKLAVDLARQKNREDEPKTFQSIPLSEFLKEGDDTERWEEGGVILDGYVVDVKPGGVETCNCRTTDALFKDTHIELAPTKNAVKSRRVVVEVTPRFRLLKAEVGVDWTTSTLRQTLKGRRIRVKGWLFFDKEHECGAQNTRKKLKPDCHGRDRTIWRATVWEAHPVTDIEILK